jgi:hypothetical protein
MGVKRTIATEFKKIALTHLLLLVMINCVYDDLGPAPRAMTASPRECCERNDDMDVVDWSCSRCVAVDVAVMSIDVEDHGR